LGNEAHKSHDLEMLHIPDLKLLSTSGGSGLIYTQRTQGTVSVPGDDQTMRPAPVWSKSVFHLPYLLVLRFAKWQNARPPWRNQQRAHQSFEIASVVSIFRRQFWHKIYHGEELAFGRPGNDDKDRSRTYGHQSQYARQDAGTYEYLPNFVFHVVPKRFISI
jgi:hypothetical protein